MNLVIGSGDISALMSGINTKTHQDLMRKFVSEDKPYYNALNSPIDALRTGAIMEQRYLSILPDNYFIQYKCQFSEMDVFISSIDFAKIENGLISDFDELKSIYFTDFIDIIEPIKGTNEYLSTIKKTFKKYYNQVQCQLMCSGLESCNIVFMAVDSYEDSENIDKEITDNMIAKFRIYRDETVISDIKNRGLLFQKIRDYFIKEKI